MTAGERSVPVVAAVIRRDSRYLLCRRPRAKRHGGLWEFPGGKVREGESRLEAVRRELAEELSLGVVELGELLFSAADEGAPFTIEFVEAATEGEPVLHEHEDLGWFGASALARLPLAPADARFAAWLRERTA